ncbi:hypothetical protein [Alishewanella sp. SMS8]|uniref:hypothetical protein n=1 Tax=Alishewanella sp. SMS8 TaxID=2994676 RepID=UPI002741E91E|nr:hypothetical protein [Alishewanella sp. SMS8]MDP4946605.1 hypothetical protein [Alishewanella sp.]MDP5036379.1 hypothetical protein [Alishewanella sp.]MDP5187024.1 hypothetical protein [Alishewanella sp.]MDP5459421.1 hypothetical protein [Alishewanella sp. SMS8]
MRNRGMVLLTALLFLTVMLLVVGSNLFISKLSAQSAQAAQQQLQLEFRALEQHLMMLNNVDPEELPRNSWDMPACPAIYAAWSDPELQCELLFVETALRSDERPVFARYNSILLRKRFRFAEDQP